MANVVDLLNAHTGKVWLVRYGGHDNRSVIMTCPELPYTVVWNSWVRLYNGKVKLFEARRFDSLLSFYDKNLERVAEWRQGNE